MGHTQDLMYWNFSVHKCNLYSWASQAIGNWAHCCAQTVTLHYADCHSSLCVERTDASIPLFRLQSIFYDNLWMVTHDCQMWSDFGYLQFSSRDTKFHPPTSPYSTWVLTMLMGDKLQEFGVFAFWHITCDACC